MKLLSLLLGSLLLPTLFTSGCRKDPPPSVNDYVVFGHFYGFCSGEQCIELYKYQGGKLYEDQRDYYPTSTLPYDGKWVQLEDTLAVLGEEVRRSLPDSMLLYTDSIFGMPDAVDQGGTYVELNRGGVRYYWVMDNSQGGLPEYMQPFSELVRERSRFISQRSR